jgi:hypothetical protein
VSAGRGRPGLPDGATPLFQPAQDEIVHRLGRHRVQPEIAVLREALGQTEAEPQCGDDRQSERERPAPKCAAAPGRVRSRASHGSPPFGQEPRHLPEREEQPDGVAAVHLRQALDESHEQRSKIGIVAIDRAEQ